MRTGFCGVAGWVWVAGGVCPRCIPRGLNGGALWGGGGGGGFAAPAKRVGGGIVVAYEWKEGRGGEWWVGWELGGDGVGRDGRRGG